MSRFSVPAQYHHQETMPCLPLSAAIHSWSASHPYLKHLSTVTKWLLQYTHPHMKWHSGMGVPKAFTLQECFHLERNVSTHMPKNKHPVEFPLCITGQNRIPCLSLDQSTGNRLPWLVQTTKNSFPGAGIRVFPPWNQNLSWIPHPIYVNKIGILTVRKEKKGRQ